MALIRLHYVSKMLLNIFQQLKDLSVTSMIQQSNEGRPLTLASAEHAFRACTSPITRKRFRPFQTRSIAPMGGLFRHPLGTIHRTHLK